MCRLPVGAKVLSKLQGHMSFTLPTAQQANLFGHVERSHSSPNLARVVLSDSRQGSRSATPQGSRTVSRTVTPRGSRAPSPVRASSLLVDDSQVDSYPADVCVEHGDAVECKSLPAWAQDYADLMSLPEGASTPQKLQLVKKMVALPAVLQRDAPRFFDHGGGGQVICRLPPPVRVQVHVHVQKEQQRL